MKNIITLVFSFISLLVFAQKDPDYFFGKKKTLKAEIIMENGTTKTGVLKDFNVNKVRQSAPNNFISIENTFNYDTKEYEFKENNKPNSEKIHINDIKSITTYSDDGSEQSRYDKLKLKTVNSKHEIVDLNKTVLLPLMQEGKLNLYGFWVSYFSYGNAYGVGTVNQGYSTTLLMPYLRNSNSEYAYLPFDLNRMNIFNIGKMEGKFKIALQEATKSCPEFQSNIDEIMKLFEKSNKANMKKQYYDREAQKKQIRKDIKDKDVELMLQIKTDTDYMVKPYLELVNSYNSKCKQ